MLDNTIFPPVPAIIPFTRGHIFHLFPVLRKNSIGIVYGERWAIATINEDDIRLDNFPEKEFSIPTAKAMPQKYPEQLYVRTPRSVDLLNWNKKVVIAGFIDNSKTIANALNDSKVCDYDKGIVISVFNYDGDDGDMHYSFVIDDIINEKRLKEIPIEKFEWLSPLYFTPTYTIFRTNSQTPWLALDNNLFETTHPLVDLLNKDKTDSVFAVVDNNMFISEELKHAFIISYSKIVKKDKLFLARWYDKPEVIPIPIDSSATEGERRLMTASNVNTISPSGKWVYFSTDGGRFLENTHYLIYLDPSLPNGFISPFKINIEGDIGQASWMTDPEGLVLYRNGELLYFDLSKFDVQNF